MLLSNFTQVCTANPNTSQDIILTSGSTVTSYVTIANSLNSVQITDTIYNSNTSWTYTGNDYLRIICGDGETAPAISDYKLSGNLLLNGNTTSGSILITNNGFTVTETFINSSEEDVTIRELGLVVIKGTNPSSYGAILLTRDLIEPITLGVGDGRAFSVYINTQSFITEVE